MIRVLALLPLLLAWLIAPTMTHGATASSEATHSAILVVATSLSNVAPRVGQHETVTVQFFLYQPKKKPQYLAGAHLSVAVRVGTMKTAQALLETIKGTTTNDQGKAFAHFTVPNKVRGKVLWADTMVTYKGQRHTGSNRVLVAK